MSRQNFASIVRRVTMPSTLPKQDDKPGILDPGYEPDGEESDSSAAETEEAPAPEPTGDK